MICIECGNEKIESEDNFCVVNFTYKELALLNKMIGIAFRSGEIEFDEVSKSVHKKVADEIVKRNSTLEESEIRCKY